MQGDINHIVHTGRVESVNEGWLEVSVIPESACGSCKAKGACGMGEGDERLITVITPYSHCYSEGEEVEVSITRAMGLKAVFLVYILPFLIVFSSLVTLILCEVKESISGIISLGMVAVYYFLLYLFRNSIEKEIRFDVKKIKITT